MGLTLKKRAFRLFLYFFVSIIIPQYVSAARSYIPKPIEDVFMWLFSTLPKAAQSSASAQNIAVVYFKFFLWVLLFALYFYGATKIIKDNRRIAGAVAFVLALTSTMMIPAKVVIFIFNEYGTVTAIFMALLPLIICLYIWHSIPHEHRIIRGVIIILVGIIAMWVGGYFMSIGLSLGAVP